MMLVSCSVLGLEGIGTSNGEERLFRVVHEDELKGSPTLATKPVATPGVLVQLAKLELGGGACGVARS
jgi:hypothetical protein